MSSSERTEPTRHSSAARRRFDVPPSVIVAASILAVFAVCAIVPAPIASHDPSLILPAEKLQPPSSQHWFGTDQLGRDVYSRVIFGVRGTIFGALIIAAATTFISVVLALVAGYFGGWTDAVVSRATDLLYSLPPLIVAIVVVGVFDGGYWLAVGVLVVLNVPQNVRVFRASVMERRGLPYVEAAEVLGNGPITVMARHILPNIAPIVAAGFFLRFTYGIVDLAALSFLGLGVPPGSTDWGRMLAENRVDVFQQPWAAIAPGVALVLLAVSANFVGEWLFEHYESKARTR